MDARVDAEVSGRPWITWLVALGLALRLYHYGRNPAVWHDEAANIINVIQKNFTELLGPLSYSATGPPVFLWMQRAAVLALGDGTYALRLISLLASCAGLFLFARLARRTLAGAGAISAVLLVACSDRLLWHAAEARHYSSDFLVAIVLLTLVSATREWPSQRRAYLFAALAPLIIFSSYPGVFLCGAVFVALLPTLCRDRCWTAGTTLGIAITLSFIAFVFITIQPQRSAAMDAAWVHLFPDWQRPGTVPFWAVRSTVGVFDYIGRPIGGILIALAIIGGVQLWHTGRSELVLFAVTPLALAMIAALAKSYPYTGARTMVFAMPALVLLIGAGVDAVAAWRPPRREFKWIAIAAAVIPIAATFGFSLYRVAIPWPRAETATASAYVLAHRQPDEPVTANHWEYEYYFRKLGAAFVPGMRLLDRPEQPERIWIVVTGREQRDRDALINAQPRWSVLERHEFVGTTVVLAAPRP